VDQTDVWKRVYLSPEIQQKFKKTATNYLSSVRGDTDTVALQYDVFPDWRLLFAENGSDIQLYRETPRTSDSDARAHFSAVEIDGQGSVVAKRHFSVE
jgi:hypothetical protein